MRTLSHGLRGALIAVALLAGTARGSGGFLGVNVNDAEDGVKILSVRDGSAAASAGLVAGDVVAAVGDRAIATPGDLSDALSKASPGDTVDLKIRRDGANRRIAVTLGTRPVADVAPAMEPAAPAAAPSPPTPPVLAEAKPSLPAIPLIPSPSAQEPAPPVAQNAPAAPAMDEAPRKGGFLGVTLDGSSGKDTVIGSVVDGSPAANAKLKAGDEIVAIDGVEVATAEAISAELSKKEPGRDVEIAVLRDGQRKLRTATLGSYGSIGFPAGTMMPVPAAPAPSMEKRAKKDAPAGLVVREKKAQEAEAKEEPKKSTGRGWLGVYLSMDDGVVIDDTAEGGPAEGAGLKAGDKIVKLGSKKIESTDDLLAALEGKAGEDVAIVVMRDGAEKRIGVTLGTPPTDMAGAAPMPAQPKKAESKKAESEVAAKAKKKADAAKQEADSAAERALAAEKKAKTQAEMAKKRAKEAAEKAEGKAKEAATKAEKRAKEAAEKARATAKDAEKSAKASAKKRTASPAATWFFPTGTELSVRIEEKDGGYWITSGSGQQGIEVPADAITNLSIEAKGGGVEVRVHGGKPHTLTTFGSMSDDGHHVVVAPQLEGGATTTWKVDDHGHFTVLGSKEGTEPHVFTFETDAGDSDHHVIRLKKSDGDGAPVILHRSRRGDGESHVEVKKGDVHVVPHAPHGGGIVIHNNGGTVIIGDGAAHALRAREGKAKEKAKKDTD